MELRRSLFENPEDVLEHVRKCRLQPEDIVTIQERTRTDDLLVVMWWWDNGLPLSDR